MANDERRMQAGDFVQTLNGVFQYSHALNGMVDYVSPSVTAILGYSVEAFLCPFDTYFADSPVNDDVKKLRQLCCQGIQQEPYEVCMYHKSGAMKWLLVTEAPRLNLQGEVLAVDGIAFDITAQKELQNELMNELHREKGSHQVTHGINRQSLKQVARVRKLWNETQRSYEREKKRYHSIISHSFDAILILDASGNIKEVNPAAVTLFGWPNRAFLQKNINDIIPEFHCNVDCGDCFSRLHEVVGFHQNKQQVFLEVIPNLIMLRNETFISITIRDISGRKEAESLVQEHQLRLESRVAQRTAQLKHANDELQTLANKMEALNCLDELTGIYNRRGFDQEFDKEWKRAYRAKNSIAIIMIDIDYFKQFNDGYGHQAGDMCLKKVSATLANSVHRNTDRVCRYGGEEFVAVLPETSEQGALHVAELFRKEIEQLQVNHRASTVSDYVTISLGVAVSIPCDGKEQDGLLKQADQALYQAKESRNQVVLAALAPSQSCCSH